MRVVEIDPRSDSRWGAFVAGQPDALVFHHPAWLRALIAAYGYEPAVLACEDDTGNLTGVLPLVRKRGWVTGRRLVSLPHTPVAGPLAADQAIRRMLAAAAVERAGHGVRVELKTPTHEPLDGLAAVPWSATYVLRLPADPDALRFGSSRNHRRIRWAVNKAEKQGVQLRVATGEGDLRAWHQLYLETMRAHAMPPRPYRFFCALWDSLRPAGLLRLLLAEQRGRLVAGSMFLMFGSTVFYAFNGRRPEDLGLRPNDVLQWRALHDARAAGFLRYDFGEVEAQQRGLAEFKAKWGAEPVTLYRHVHPPRPSSGNGSRVPTRPRAWAQAAWRRLPLAATARIGDVVYGRL